MIRIYDDLLSFSSSMRNGTTDSLNTLSHHPSLLIIALDKSCKQHPVSALNCRMYLFSGQPRLICTCIGVHQKTSLSLHVLIVLFEYWCNDHTPTDFWGAVLRICSKQNAPFFCGSYFTLFPGVSSNAAIQ